MVKNEAFYQIDCTSPQKHILCLSGGPMSEQISSQVHLLSPRIVELGVQVASLGNISVS